MADNMSNRLRALTTAMATWHVACLVMYLVIGHVIGQLILAAYTAWFGDIQESYSRYARLATYLGFVFVTAPASFVSLRLFDRLLHRPVKWTLVGMTFLGWQLVVVAILIGFYEGLADMIHQLDWALFGLREIYSFRNLILHRIIAWLLCTTPVAWIALKTYSK